MGTFVLYKTIPNSTIKREGEKAVAGIEKWFADNPKRRVCNAEVWYGKRAKIRKGHVQEDMDKAVEAAVK